MSALCTMYYLILSLSLLSFHSFYSNKQTIHTNEQNRYDRIAEANVKLENIGLTDTLVDLLRKVLAKDPAVRAGVGDCLKHPFCVSAREQRLRELGDEVENHDAQIIVHSDDLQQVGLLAWYIYCWQTLKPSIVSHQHNRHHCVYVTAGTFCNKKFLRSCSCKKNTSSFTSHEKTSLNAIFII